MKLLKTRVFCLFIFAIFLTGCGNKETTAPAEEVTTEYSEEVTTEVVEEETTVVEETTKEVTIEEVTVEDETAADSAKNSTGSKGKINFRSNDDLYIGYVDEDGNVLLDIIDLGNGNKHYKWSGVDKWADDDLCPEGYDPEDWGSKASMNSPYWDWVNENKGAKSDISMFY